ncbi:RNA polymerase sigma factor [Aeromicrobium sp.]|uniref:RNA polymerase sigma factor n=1 Tax=Aeromicrobium sp. TaxID=1871063 RepID=UPI002FC85992
MSADPPDWAALYLSHRDAMYRVAASVLRGFGIADQADDVVQDAMVSLMGSPPSEVNNWEAMMVSAAKNRALDRVGSAAVRHAGPELDPHRLGGEAPDIADDVAESLDRQRLAAKAWDHLGILDDRHRKVAWEYIALGRDRTEVAAELGVSPARVSQMAKKAAEDLREAFRREGENL